MKVLAVCGSLQTMSANRALLGVAASRAPAGVKLEIFDRIADMPHFSPDLPADLPAVTAWREALAASDALLIASPEYGFSLPGALKNAIDWVIGTAELEGKVVGVTASTSAPGRGERGLKALTDTLEAVSAKVVGGVPIVRGPEFENDVAHLIEAIAERVGQ